MKFNIEKTEGIDSGRVFYRKSFYGKSYISVLIEITDYMKTFIEKGSSEFPEKVRIAEKDCTSSITCKVLVCAENKLGENTGDRNNFHYSAHLDFFKDRECERNYIKETRGVLNGNKS